jgi:hypothetical protein
MFPIEMTLVVNDDQPIISRLAALSDLPSRADEADLLAHQIYDLARLGHGSLTAEDMATFLKRSTTLLDQLADKDLT